MRQDRSMHLICSTSVVTVVSILLWQGIRSRLQKLACNADVVTETGPMVSHDVDSVRKSLKQLATLQASDLATHQFSDFGRLESQVGGISAHKSLLLNFSPGYVMKPVRLDHRGSREIAFYLAVKMARISNEAYSGFSMLVKNARPRAYLNTLAFGFGRLFGNTLLAQCQEKSLKSGKQLEREAKLLRRLSSFIPEYLGVASEQTSSISIRGSYLVLRDETCNFFKPCSMDIKLGTETFEPDAPEDKKIRERNKCGAQAEFGFRIVGFRVYDPHNQDSGETGFVFCPKSVGRSLTTRDAVKKELNRYLSPRTSSGSSKPTFATDACTRILSALSHIEEWFADNDCLRFCSSSILLCYEGDALAMATVGRATVKLIDFARVRRETGGDPGCLLGVRTIISLLNEILLESSR